ncbi:MAG: phasin family protein [Hyphomicrobiaceae bacterium]
MSTQDYSACTASPRKISTCKLRFNFGISKASRILHRTINFSKGVYRRWKKCRSQNGAIPACAMQQRLELAMSGQQFDLNQQLLAAAKDARIPDEIQELTQQGVAKSREFYRQFNAAASAQVKALEDFLQTTQAGLKSLSEKIGANAAANTEAAFEAAKAIARAKTIPEAGRLQAEFMQQQFAAATAQAQELFELSIKLSQRTIEAASEATSNSFNKIDRSS